MATYSFSSLEEILKHQPSQKPKFMGSPFQQTKSESGIPYEDDDYVTEMFGEPYFKKSPSSPHSLSPPLLPLSTSSSLPDPRTLQTMIEKLNDEANHEKKKNSAGKHSVTENKCMYNKRFWTSKEKLLPPPISYLKLSKIGKPFVYFKLDEDSGRFVRKEIRIPPHGVLAALRENGHLKLYFAHEEEEEEEEVEAYEEQEIS